MEIGLPPIPQPFLGEEEFQFIRKHIDEMCKAIRASRSNRRVPALVAALKHFFLADGREQQYVMEVQRRILIEQRYGRRKKD